MVNPSNSPYTPSAVPGNLDITNTTSKDSSDMQIAKVAEKVFSQIPAPSQTGTLNTTESNISVPVTNTEKPLEDLTLKELKAKYVEEGDQEIFNQFQKKEKEEWDAPVKYPKANNTLSKFCAMLSCQTQTKSLKELQKEFNQKVTAFERVWKNQEVGKKYLNSWEKFKKRIEKAPKQTYFEGSDDNRKKLFLEWGSRFIGVLQHCLNEVWKEGSDENKSKLESVLASIDQSGDESFLQVCLSGWAQKIQSLEHTSDMNTHPTTDKLFEPLQDMQQIKRALLNKLVASNLAKQNTHNVNDYENFNAALNKILDLGYTKLELGNKSRGHQWCWRVYSIESFVNYVQDKCPAELLSNLEDKYQKLSREEKETLFAKALDMYFEQAKEDPRLLLDKYPEADELIDQLKKQEDLKQLKVQAQELNQILPGFIDIKSAHEKIESNGNNIRIVELFFNKPKKTKIEPPNFEQKIKELKTALEDINIDELVSSHDKLMEFGKLEESEIHSQSKSNDNNKNEIETTISTFQEQIRKIDEKFLYYDKTMPIGEFIQELRKCKDIVDRYTDEKSKYKPEDQIISIKSQITDEKLISARAQKNKQEINDMLMKYPKFGASAWAILSKAIEITPTSEGSDQEKILSWMQSLDYTKVHETSILSVANQVLEKDTQNRELRTAIQNYKNKTDDDRSPEIKQIIKVVEGKKSFSLGSFHNAVILKDDNGKQALYVHQEVLNLLNDSSLTFDDWLAATKHCIDNGHPDILDLVVAAWPKDEQEVENKNEISKLFYEEPPLNKEPFLKACLKSNAFHLLSYFNQEDQTTFFSDALKDLIKDKRYEMALGLLEKFPEKISTLAHSEHLLILKMSCETGNTVLLEKLKASLKEKGELGEDEKIREEDFFTDLIGNSNVNLNMFLDLLKSRKYMEEDNFTSTLAFKTLPNLIKNGNAENVRFIIENCASKDPKWLRRALEVSIDNNYFDIESYLSVPQITSLIENPNLKNTLNIFRLGLAAKSSDSNSFQNHLDSLPEFTQLSKDDERRIKTLFVNLVKANKMEAQDLYQKYGEKNLKKLFYTELYLEPFDQLFTSENTEMVKFILDKIHKPYLHSIQLCKIHNRPDIFAIVLDTLQKKESDPSSILTHALKLFADEDKLELAKVLVRKHPTISIKHLPKGKVLTLAKILKSGAVDRTSKKPINFKDWLKATQFCIEEKQFDVLDKLVARVYNESLTSKYKDAIKKLFDNNTLEKDPFLKACLKSNAFELLSIFDEKDQTMYLSDTLRDLITTRGNEEYKKAVGLLKKFPGQIKNLTRDTNLLILEMSAELGHTKRFDRHLKLLEPSLDSSEDTLKQDSDTQIVKTTTQVQNPIARSIILHEDLKQRLLEKTLPILIKTKNETILKSVIKEYLSSIAGWQQAALKASIEHDYFNIESLLDENQKTSFEEVIKSSNLEKILNILKLGVAGNLTGNLTEEILPDFLKDTSPLSPQERKAAKDLLNKLVKEKKWTLLYRVRVDLFEDRWKRKLLTEGLPTINETKIALAINKFSPGIDDWELKALDELYKMNNSKIIKEILQATNFELSAVEVANFLFKFQKDDIEGNKALIEGNKALIEGNKALTAYLKDTYLKKENVEEFMVNLIEQVKNTIDLRDAINILKIVIGDDYKLIPKIKESEEIQLAAKKNGFRFLLLPDSIEAFLRRNLD